MLLRLWKLRLAGLLGPGLLRGWVRMRPRQAVSIHHAQVNITIRIFKTT